MFSTGRDFPPRPGFAMTSRRVARSGAVADGGPDTSASPMVWDLEGDGMDPKKL